MLRARLIPAVLLVALGAPAAGERDTTPPLGILDKEPQLHAFVGATIVVSPDRTVEDGVLIVRDGLVERVGRGIEVPPGATVVDLRGGIVYPGLVDPYTEYGLAHVGPLNPKAGSDEPKLAGTRLGADSWNDAIHADREWAEAFRPDEERARELRARGVTTVLSVKRDGVFRGRSFVASLGRGRPAELLLLDRGPHALAFDKGSSEQLYPTSLMGSIALVRQTFLDARWYAAATAVDADPDERPEPDRPIEALARYAGPFFFETEDARTLLRAARIGAELDLPFVFVGSNRESARLEEVRALGRPVVLPLAFPGLPEVAGFEDQLDVRLEELRHWERAPSNAAALEAAGVPFAFTGLDLDRAKQDLWDNVRRAVRRGLSARGALAALTTVPARLCGVEALAGSLEPGRRADFFVAEGDPFVADVPIRAVWIAGVRTDELRAPELVGLPAGFDLELEGLALDLAWSIERRDDKPERPRGKLGAGDESVAVEDVSTEPGRLHFRADLPALGAGSTRFSLVHLGNRWSGTAALPDGRRVPVAVREENGRAPFEEDESRREKREAREKEDARLVSRLTYPPVAYGLEARPRAEDVLVRGATIWTGEAEGILENADLLVAAGKIAAVGKGLRAPSGVRVIDAAGKHVTAGLIDEHSHLAISRGVNEGSHSVTAEVRIGDVVDPDDVGIYRALAGGATTAQLLHGSANAIGGQAQVIKLRWSESAEGLKLAGVTPTIKFALGENVKQSNWGDRHRVRYPQSRMGVESLMRDRLTAARDYGRRWREYDALPAAERASTVPPRRDLQLEALLEVLESRRLVHCHSYRQAEILMLMRLAEELGFRVATFTHILEGYKVADEMAAHGAAASSFSDWWAYKFEVYDAIPHNTCILHDRGVVTSVNSDSDEVIRRLNQEAAKSVLYCGMDPHEALKLVTLNPAIQLRIDDRVGSLRAGKDADFVIWSGEPLSVYSRVEETWIEGVRRFSVEEDRRLQERDRREKADLVQKALGLRKPEERKGAGDAPPAAAERHRRWHCDDVEDEWHATHD